MKEIHNRSGKNSHIGVKYLGNIIIYYADFILVITVPVAIFLIFFHVQVLDPHNIYWLLRGTDNGEGALGLHAWLNDPTAQGLKTNLLNFPDGVPLLFTDSNPLLATILSPFRRWIGMDVQFVGILYLIALLLHVIFARLLLKPYAPSRLSLWCGIGFLSLLPTLYTRQIHVNLFNHWVILWTLWLFTSPRRAGDWRCWFTLLGISAMLHSYLLVMVGAIWGSALLERLASPGSELSRQDRIQLALGSAASLLLLAAILVVLGVDTGVVASRTYGRFGMPLDALWNPALSSFSAFLPAIPQAPDRQLEAFQYLGAGLLLLLWLTPWIARHTAADEEIRTLNRRLLWLIPALVALGLIAITNRIDFAGRTLATLPLPNAVIIAIDPLRASSRMFWPVSYVLAFFAITTAYRMSHKRVELVVGGLLALQILDLVGLALWTREQTAASANPATWIRTHDPRWQRAIALSRDVTFVPGDATLQLDLFQEVAWRAVDARRPVRIVYAARNNRNTTRRLLAEDQDFAAGRLDPHRLYILLPNTIIPIQATERFMILDGVKIILPVAATKL